MTREYIVQEMEADEEKKPFNSEALIALPNTTQFHEAGVIVVPPDGNVSRLLQFADDMGCEVVVRKRKS